MRIRRNGGEFEGLGLLRTFVGDPATAQWATVGEAPAPQLNDLPRPLACADKRRDPEEGRVGAERGAFYKGTAPPLTTTHGTRLYRL